MLLWPHVVAPARGWPAGLKGRSRRGFGAHDRCSAAWHPCRRARRRHDDPPAPARRYGLDDRLVHGHQFGAVGKGGFHLHLGNHLGHALHHVVATEQGRLLAPLASSGHPRQTYLPRPGIAPARDLPASKKHAPRPMAWLSSVLRLPPIVQRSVPSMSSPKQRSCPSCDNQAVPGPRHRRQLAASEQHPVAVSKTQNGMATLSHPWATVGCVYLGSCGTPAVDWRRRATSATMNLAQSVPKLTGRRAKTVPQCMVMLTLRLCCTSPPHLQRTP